jgi:hypothetical protein
MQQQNHTSHIPYRQGVAGYSQGVANPVLGRVWQPLPVFVVTSWSALLALLAMPAASCL